MLSKIHSIAFASINIAFAAASISPSGMSVTEVIDKAFPGEHWYAWEYTQGDLNNDGIDDLAVIMAKTYEVGDRPERLAVFYGNRDGSFKLISASKQFCNVPYHYNLYILRDSLFIEGFNHIDPSRMSSYTLQFRYNIKRKDFQLIGEEFSSSNERQSTNYLSKRTTYISKNKNGKSKEITHKIQADDFIGLSDFECSSYRKNLKEL